MSISYNDIGENLRRIVVSGRLDMPGTDSIAAQLDALAAAPKKAWSLICRRSNFSPRSAYGR